MSMIIKEYSQYWYEAFWSTLANLGNDHRDILVVI